MSFGPVVWAGVWQWAQPTPLKTRSPTSASWVMGPRGGAPR
jgi:hypothetical protein